MSIGSAYTKQSIRIGDKTPTAKALVDFGTIATDSFQGKSKAEHSGFQSEEGLLAGKNTKSTRKVNLAPMFYGLGRSINEISRLGLLPSA